ncbi:MAG: GNAT family N-acetyltransferase [Gemmatimonadaceae bacterium]
MRPGIQTERLTLRELTHDDLDFVASMLSDPEVMRYYPKALTRAESLGWIEKQRARYTMDGHGLWLVSLVGSGEPVGQVGLALQHVDDGHEPEIGWLLHRPYWGHGYASEAAIAVRDHAFVALGMPYVISLIRPENEPSRRVAQRVGMIVQRRAIFHGYEHDVWRLDRADCAQ